jgi:hypothetical protein
MHCDYYSVTVTTEFMIFIRLIFYTSKIRIEFHKCNNVFSNKIKPLHVSANDGHHRKAANTSKEMLHMYYMHVVMYGLHYYLK